MYVSGYISEDFLLCLSQKHTFQRFVLESGVLYLDPGKGVAINVMQWRC